MQTEFKSKAKFLKALYERLIWDSDEASLQIFSLDESHWDYHWTTVNTDKSKPPLTHQETSSDEQNHAHYG